ncbi:MAG: hypothetical protein ACRECH_09225 [Nitrososphaerales archaeon]
MSSENPDIRKQVDQNRGFLKKLELLVPGLAGYRDKEDIRVADELLRNQVADKLDQARANLESLRKQLVNNGDFTNLTSLGSLINQIQQLSGQVRHSEQGYSGLAATIKVDQTRLDSLYEYDYNFVASAAQLLSITSPANLIYNPTAPNSVQPALASVGSAISDYKQKWAVRIEAVEGIMVQ